MKTTKFKLTRADQRLIRAAERAAMAAWRASAHTDPARRFAAGMSALVGAMFRPRKISTTVNDRTQNTEHRTP